MKLMLKFLFLFLGFLIVFSSCKKDDDNVNKVPIRERSEEAINAMAEIEAFLSTHFYNYEEFENPPAGFDYKIKFDTIEGVNSGKIPLIDKVVSKIVTDRVDPEVTYTLYFLHALEGQGESPIFADATTLSYQGKLLDKTNFDSSEVPVRLDLTQVVPGFQEGLVEFKAATNFAENPDGTVNFENFGVGAIFIPSGLAYYVSPPATSSIPLYAQLIFTFQLYDVTKNIDHDEDGIPSFLEDVNENENLYDDDTDGDGIPDFLDNDDDGDGVLTRDEIIINEDGSITFPDSNGNGIPDYRDPTYPNN